MRLLWLYKDVVNGDKEEGSISFWKTIVLRFKVFVHDWMFHQQIYSCSHIQLQGSDATSWARRCGKTNL